ncbi:PTS fructose transporter subunit IIA [Lachnospiraceae bacterium 54-53]
MIGIIVTGHGEFASGLASGLKLFAGKPEYFEAVDFNPEESIENLTDRLAEALNKLSGCEAVAVFTDLTGGSPYNVASGMKRSGRYGDLEVAGGSNLPMVFHAYQFRTMITDVRELLDASLEEGKSQMVRFQDSDSDEEEWEVEE